MFGRQDDNIDTDQPQNDWQHPGAPINDDRSNPDMSQAAPAEPPVPQPHDDTATDQSNGYAAAENEAQVVAPHEDAPAAPTAPTEQNDELIDIKRQALGQLTPLVGHLDQSPEEKFRTTMMMIQASDDQSLVKVAYEAARQISDEKVRAQALLDIINEINYFTQPKS